MSRRGALYPLRSTTANGSLAATRPFWLHDECKIRDGIQYRIEPTVHALPDKMFNLIAGVEAESLIILRGREQFAAGNCELTCLQIFVADIPDRLGRADLLKDEGLAVEVGHSWQLQRISNDRYWVACRQTAFQWVSTYFAQG